MHTTIYEHAVQRLEQPARLELVRHLRSADARIGLEGSPNNTQRDLTNGTENKSCVVPTAVHLAVAT